MLECRNHLAGPRILWGARSVLLFLVLFACTAGVTFGSDPSAATRIDSCDGCLKQNCADECGKVHDDRDLKQATIFLGSAIDNFAAQELRSYLNPEDSSKSSSLERLIGGIQFAWRAPHFKYGDLWIQGLTVHGVRSADVDCAETPDIPVCKKYEGEIDVAKRFLYIVRNASSLEAALMLKWEPSFGVSESLRLFVSAQAGFVTVTGTDGDVKDQHHVGVGVVDPSGVMRESYLEVGYGRSDLFHVHRDSRWKINGFLSLRPKKWKATSAFARIAVDSDLGRGADSIQSYFGLRFDACRVVSGFGKVIKRSDSADENCGEN
jgi:hypothetical protein